MLSSAGSDILHRQRSSERFSLFDFFLAYRLKKCPPPPTVEEAEILYEDEDYEIGMYDAVKTQHT